MIGVRHVQSFRRNGFRREIIALTAFVTVCGCRDADVTHIANRHFHRHAGHWYALTSEPASWEDAEAEAVALGGHLVAIGDAEEQEFLERTFMAGRDPRSGAILWIGLTDRDEEAVFRWSNGEPIRYVNWTSETREPTNRGPAMGPDGPIKVEEDFVAANWHWVHGDPSGRIDYRKGTWNDVPLHGSAAPDGYHTDGPYRGIIELTALPREGTPINSD